MSKKVSAWIHKGQWIATCPDCGALLNIENRESVICAQCYPGLSAMAYRLGNDGLLRPEPDCPAREEAAEKARREKNEIEIVYPKNKDEIMEILRPRPRENMNFHPAKLRKTMESFYGAGWWGDGDTLTSLRRENKDHGIEV